MSGDSTAAQLSSEAASHQRHLEKLYNHFVRQEGVRDSQCLVVNQKKPKNEEDDDEAYDGSSQKKKEVMHFHMHESHTGFFIHTFGSIILALQLDNY